MADQITNYQCPACTGPLHFVGASGRLECDYCGSSYSVEEIEAIVARRNRAGCGAFRAYYGHTEGKGGA
ncbi:MAG: Trm112 family protein [Acutalibacteraceae bacterium]